MERKKISIQSSILWNSAGSIVYLVTQWIISIFVVRFSGVEDAGNLTLAMSVNNIFYSIAMQGIRNFQVSDTNEKYKDHTYVYNRILSCILSFSICLLYCGIIQYSSEQKICIIAYCLFKMSEALYDVYAGICQKNWRMDYIGKSWMIKGIVTLGAFVGFYLISGNLLWAILGMAISSYIVVGVYDVPKTHSLSQIRISLKDKDCLKLTIECFPLLCYLILSTIVPTIPRIFMERILGNYALGIYGSIATPTAIVQMGASYIFNPFLTLFAEQYNSGKIVQFRNTMKKCILTISCFSVIALIGGKILGKWGLNLIYGSEVAEYVSLLLPLILCTILTSLVWFLCALLTVVREFKGLIISNLIVVILSGISSIFCLKIFGMQGASIALGISLGVEILFLWLFLKKKLNSMKTDQEKN